MKKLTIIFLPSFLLAAGCGDGDNKKDGDVSTDRIEIPDIQPDRDITQEPDLIPEPPDTIEIQPDNQEIPDITQEETSTTCNPVYNGECNLVDNCNCSGGTGCRLFINSSVECSVIEQCAPSGTVPTGGDCHSDSDCAIGNACLTSPVWGTKCIRWCDDDSDCPSGHSCSIPVGFGPGALGENCPALTLQTYKACDLGCPSDARCNPIDGNGCTAPRNSCQYEIDCKVFYCTEPGTHQIGEDCNDGNGCVVGSECISTDGGTTFLCYEFCNNSHQCPGGKTCSSLGYPDDPSFGICE